jgi:DNA-directed RNA polymerase subunit M/transcription elongation factor TFIIS
MADSETQLFCSLCHNVYSVISTNDKLYFKCQKCKNTAMPGVLDSLRYEEKAVSLSVYSTLLQNAGRDPVNPKVERNCPKCKYTIAKQIRIGNDMRLINTCVKCDHHWAEANTE